MNANVAQKQQKEQDLTPQEQFTGKSLTRFGGVGLLRRLFEKRKLRKQLETVSVRDRRNSDYSPAQMCMGMLYALMLGIFRPSHMMELVRDKVFQSGAKLRKFPVRSTISRFLDKVTVHTALQIAEINSRLLNEARESFKKFKALTLDLDAIVMLQTGKGAEMGAAFGGASQTLFGGSGGSSFMSKLTTGAAVVFMITCLLLSFMYRPGVRGGR